GWLLRPGGESYRRPPDETGPPQTAPRVGWARHAQCERVPVAIAERPRSTGMYARRTTPGRRSRFLAGRPCQARTDVCATGWSVSTTDPRFCRNECFIRAHIYTWTGILTHASSALPTIVVQPFD